MNCVFGCHSDRHTVIKMSFCRKNGQVTLPIQSLHANVVFNKLLAQPLFQGWKINKIPRWFLQFCLPKLYTKTRTFSKLEIKPASGAE